MYIDRIMTRKVISVSAQTRINEMLELMQNNDLQHLPVVDKSGELIGIVSHQDIQKATPSAITTLSIGEANYLLAKITAKEIMQEHVVFCEPNTLIEQAGQILREQNISSLPVVHNNSLVGIVTTEDVLDFFLDLTGCRQIDATRIAVRLSDEKGSLSHLINIINQLGGYIATVVSPTEVDDEGKRICIIRYYADDPHQLDQQLKQQAIEIISENFLYESNVKNKKNYLSASKMTDIEKIAAHISCNDQIAKLMDMKIEQLDHGECRLSMYVTPRLLNGAGVLHGAATFALADVAVAIASNSHNRVALSLDSNIKYLSACKEGEQLIASTKEISLGNIIANYQVEIIRKSDDKLVALFTGTVFRKKDTLIKNS